MKACSGSSVRGVGSESFKVVEKAGEWHPEILIYEDNLCPLCAALAKIARLESLLAASNERNSELESEQTWQPRKQERTA